MARVLALGSPAWTSHRLTMVALRRVMDTFREPYTLVCDMGDGAARYAAAAAQKLGWTVERHETDMAKCAADCPKSNHRRKGGPTGDYCPTARHRNTLDMIATGIHVALVFVHQRGREDGSRSMPKALCEGGEFAVWKYIQQNEQNDQRKGSN